MIKFNCDCGFEWEKGRSGQHNCSPFYRETIDGLKLALKQNDDEIKNSESVRASIAALTDAKINGLANENDELKAMVNALRDGYKEAIVCMEGEWGEETCTEELKILSLSPAQCLASVKATAIKDAIFNSEKVEFEGSHYVGTYVSLEDLEVNIKQLGDKL